MTVAELRIEISKNEDIISEAKKKRDSYNNSAIEWLDWYKRLIKKRPDVLQTAVEYGNKAKAEVLKIQNYRAVVVELEKQLEIARKEETAKQVASANEKPQNTQITTPKTVVMPVSKIELVKESVIEPKAETKKALTLETPLVSEKVEEIKVNETSSKKMSLTTKIILASVGVIALVGVIILVKRK